MHGRLLLRDTDTGACPLRLSRVLRWNLKQDETSVGMVDPCKKRSRMEEAGKKHRKEEQAPAQAAKLRGEIKCPLIITTVPGISIVSVI